MVRDLPVLQTKFNALLGVIDNAYRESENKAYIIRILKGFLTNGVHLNNNNIPALEQVVDVLILLIKAKNKKFTSRHTALALSNVGNMWIHGYSDGFRMIAEQCSPSLKEAAAFLEKLEEMLENEGDKKIQCLRDIVSLYSAAGILGFRMAHDILIELGEATLNKARKCADVLHVYIVDRDLIELIMLSFYDFDRNLAMNDKKPKNFTVRGRIVKLQQCVEEILKTRGWGPAPFRLMVHTLRTNPWQCGNVYATLDSLRLEYSQTIAIMNTAHAIDVQTHVDNLACPNLLAVFENLQDVYNSNKTAIPALVDAYNSHESGSVGEFMQHFRASVVQVGTHDMAHEYDEDYYDEGASNAAHFFLQHFVEPTTIPMDWEEPEAVSDPYSYNAVLSGEGETIPVDDAFSEHTDHSWLWRNDSSVHDVIP